MKDTSKPSLSDAERVNLHALVSEATEAIAPNWPMRTFAYRNSLMGFEDLPFHDAVAHAKNVLGGEGYLSTSEYRACYAKGRISEKELLGALRSREPKLASQGSVRVGERNLHPEEILLLHFVYGLDPLDPKLLQWQLTEENAAHRIRPDVPQSIKNRLRSNAVESVYIHSLWSEAVKALGVSEDVSAGNHRHSPTTAKTGGTEYTGHEPQQNIRTIAEIIDTLTGSSLIQNINEHTIKWCAAFLDEGLSDWSMPARESGFYSAWRDLAPREASWLTLGVSNLSQKLEALPDHPEDALAANLNRLKVPKGQWVSYLRRHLTHLPGWAGYIRWRDMNPDYLEQGHHPINPLEYLCVRVFYEAELSETVCRSMWNITPALPDLVARAQSNDLENSDSHEHDAHTETVCRDAWRLFHLSQFLDIRPKDLQALSPTDVQSLLSPLNRFPANALRPVWHEAYETRYRNSLLTALVTHRQRSGYDESNKRPRARVQAVFCIDARSESFRRHLEAQGDYATIGFAGFFGTPIYYRIIDQEENQPLCPALIKPKYEVKEGPRQNQETAVLRFMLGDRWNKFSRHLFHQAKSNPTSSYLVFDLFGFVFGLAMLGKTVLLKPYESVREWLGRWLIPPIATQIPVEKFSEDNREAFIANNERALIAEVLLQRLGHRANAVTLSQSELEEFRLAALGETEHSNRIKAQTKAAERIDLSAKEQHDFLCELRNEYGINADNHTLNIKYFGKRRFSPQEQVAVVENALRVMSLTRDFARVVMLCGHASTTENNPYASAYHCGACGGNPGGPTARVLASLANKATVRRELLNLGIEIPNDTWFVAGEHNTTTDRITLFDLEDMPEGHGPDLIQLQNDLEAASLRNTQERCSRLPGAPSSPKSMVTANHVWKSSRDWAQVRPEWGLSSNAAFVVGRRSLTEGLSLNGRSFLHNYDQSQDTTGKALETIMTAPLVVVQTINFQYFFSATDPWAYGSGTKVLHNVVSGVGVMLGRNSDLQTGFPMQSLTTGTDRYHEPLRIVTVIEADTESISAIISRHDILKNFFNNEWMYLVSCHPTTGEFLQYQPGGTWKIVSSSTAS